jgi:hypothetical protein
VDFGVLLFLIVAVLIARAAIKAMNWADRPDTAKAARLSAPRRRLQQIAQRMRAAQQQTPAPPVPPPSRLPMSPYPVAVEVARDEAPESAYPTEASAYDPTDEPTSADVRPDTTGDLVENPTAPERTRYELSSSLDTTLSTSLTSSVIGESGSVGNGPQTVPLPPDLQQQVLELMDQGYEVMAVRLVCDEMDVGILDAHKTVRALAGLPTVM